MFLNSELQFSYAALNTPFLFIDQPILTKNLARLRNKIERMGVDFRPHFKTLKSLDAAPYLLPEKKSPVTVSTIKEAEVLANAGYTDITYAVGISIEKLPRIYRLLSKGIEIKVLLDSVDQAVAVNQFSAEYNCAVPALIEIDCDGHRGGIKPDDPELVAIAQVLHEGAAYFQGILTHAGESYYCFDSESLSAAAQNEVDAANRAAGHIRSQNLTCETVSIGSTPTAFSYRTLVGITEVRAGVYGLFDLVMARIGVCDVSDIAASIVTTVIGHNKEKRWLITDAGWMALSSDRGTSEQSRKCCYGLVKGSDGELVNNLLVTAVNQEHSIIEVHSGSYLELDQFPIGSRLHILPNHACATASMHSQYHLFDKQNNNYNIWTRIQGW